MAGSTPPHRLFVAIGGLAAAFALYAAAPGDPSPAKQVACPLHGSATHGGPRRLRLEPSGTTPGALSRGAVSLGDELQLTVSFEMPAPRMWPTSLPDTKLAAALAAQDVPGEYEIATRAGEGTLLLVPRGGEITQVVLRFAAGDLELSPSALRERLPAKRNLGAGALAVPIQTLRFADGQRAEIAIRLRAGSAGSAQQALGLQAELDLRLDASNPERSLDEQEHSFGRTALLFDVGTDGVLARASVQDSIDRQRQRMGRDLEFLLDRRLSTATRDPARYHPLSQGELDALGKLPPSPEIVDLRAGRLAPGRQPGEASR